MTNLGGGWGVGGGKKEIFPNKRKNPLKVKLKELRKGPSGGQSPRAAYRPKGKTPVSNEALGRKGGTRSGLKGSAAGSCRGFALYRGGKLSTSLTENEAADAN